MSSYLTLKRFASPDIDLLETWIKRPHVARWFPRPDEILEWAAEPPVGGGQALITKDGVAVGYLRWQVVDRETLDAVGLTDVPANAVDIDIFLGEDVHLGRGVGPEALNLLVGQLGEDEDLAVAGLTSAVDNTRAHAAFEKAGFQIVRQYSPPGFGPCHLFLRFLRS